MALRGNLRDFSLPDVFQLVQLSGKTGVLRIAGPETEGSIWFRDGEVFFAQSNWRREQLGERLVAAQRITPAALARALELRSSEAEGGRRLGEILVNEGYITQQVLETFVQEQIQDTIFDIMRWDEGDFDFEVLPAIVNEDIGLSVSVENIVMEGSRRLEEWQRIKKKVPSTDMVFKMATAPGEGTFEISLKPVEWALLLLIDGTRSVRELAVDTHSTDFDVARVVYGLFSAGLLEVPTDEEIERLRADRARREDKRAKLEAERAAREQVQMDAALDLEAQLAAQAEARRSASEAEAMPPAAEAAPELEAVPEPEIAPEAEAVPEPEIEPEPEAAPEPVVEAPRHEPEEPEFLASAGEAPSQDDMAVFEQMMASVLSPQAPEADATSAQEQPDVAPAVEVEPDGGEAESPIVAGFDFMPELAPGLGLLDSAETAPVETPVDLLPGVDFFAGDTAPGFEVEVTPTAALDEEPPSVVPSFDGASDYAQFPPAGEPEAAAVTGDFETDLRSLGLGEYPEELLQAGIGGGDLLAPETPSAPATDGFVDYGLGAELLTPEPSEAAGEAAAPLPEVSEYVVSAETSEYEPPAEARLPMSEVEAGRDQEQAPTGSDEDLDSLLASLGSGDGDSAGSSGGVISSGTEFGTEEAAESGYISTDAFLAEFDDSSLSSGLGDELTALTGGAAGRGNRPVATVNKLPEAGEGQMLHRDQMVDRSLLEKIIEGIENL